MITPSEIRKAKYGPFNPDPKSRQLASKGQGYHRILYEMIAAGKIAGIREGNAVKEVTRRGGISEEMDVEVKLDVTSSDFDGGVDVVEGKLRGQMERIDVAQAACIAFATAGRISRLFFCYGWNYQLVEVDSGGMITLGSALEKVAVATLAFLEAGGQRMPKSKQKENLLGDFTYAYEDLINNGLKFFGSNGK